MRRAAGEPRVSLAGSPRAFTLLELLVVVVIIGIILSLILKASYDGIKRAEERATQALITKLETGMTDRVDALSQQRPPRTAVHDIMAAVFLDATPEWSAGQYLPGVQRAQVIAQHDYIKAEMPDSFFVQVDPTTLSRDSAGVWPLNFVAQANMFTAATTPLWPLGDAFTLPLGASNRIVYPNANYNGIPPGAIPTGAKTSLDGGTTFVDAYYIPVTGMYGASFSAAAGIYKNLGYGPKGLDGQDNNGDGNIDDFAEGCIGLSDADVQTIIDRLVRHAANETGNTLKTNKTARAEALYAVLVEGRGPLGSTFDEDEFTSREVQDTDGDGLPEFVDAWGQPLQFFRWPIYYHSDLQKGYYGGSSGLGPYDSVFETREQNALDPNQQLLAPAWWAKNGQFGGMGINRGPGLNMGNTGALSTSTAIFARHFYDLAEPMFRNAPKTSAASADTNTHFWDRGIFFQRRAFYSKFLILSGGQDKVPGVALCGVNYDSISDGTATATTKAASGASAVAPLNIANIQLEGYAIQSSLLSPSNVPGNPMHEYLVSVGADDISNHNITAPGGVIQ